MVLNVRNGYDAGDTHRIVFRDGDYSPLGSIDSLQRRWETFLFRRMLPGSLLDRISDPILSPIPRKRNSSGVMVYIPIQSTNPPM